MIWYQCTTQQVAYETKHCFVSLLCCYTTDRYIECKIHKLLVNTWPTKLARSEPQKREPKLAQKMAHVAHKRAERFDQSRRFSGLFLEPQNQRQKLLFFTTSRCCANKKHTPSLRYHCILIHHFIRMRYHCCSFHYITLT